MDIQLKRGLLDVCVLAAIKNEDSYGYQIIKDMKPYLILSESTLYTILKRLEAAEMLYPFFRGTDHRSCPPAFTSDFFIFRVDTHNPENGYSLINVLFDHGKTQITTGNSSEIHSTANR